VSYAANYTVIVEFGADGYSDATAVREAIQAAIAHIPNVDHVGMPEEDLA
jgi:hypothetical protein